MATTFGAYNGSVSPLMKWYATYDYARTSNSNVYVTVTVVGDIINTASASYMGTGNNVVITATVNGYSQTYEIKSSSDTWRGSTNDPRSHTFEFNVGSTTAGASIPVSYSVAGSNYTAAAKVPTQSTSFSSPALLYSPSTPSMSTNIDLGNAVTIYTNRQYGNMTHNIYWYFGNRSGTVGEGVTDSVTFQTYAEWADQIPSSTSGNGTITCYTYADGVHIGTRTIYFTAYAPPSMVPSCSVSVSLVRTSEPSWGIAVKGYTKYRAVVSASGTYGSWITSYYISGGGYASSSSDYTSGVLQTVGDNVITATVTDSRGRSYSSTASVYVYDYSPPYFADAYAYRAASDGSKSNNGTYIRAGTSYGYASIGGYNGISCSVQYKQNGGSYVSAGSLSSGGAVTFGSGGISLGSSYTVLFTVSDSIQSITREIGVGTASRSFHIKRGGKGIAFGKIAETDNLVDSAWDIKAPNFIGRASSVYGEYTGAGGAQPPSYASTYQTRFNMMNEFVGLHNFGGYADVMIMNNYCWADVPYATAFAIQKNGGVPRAWIASGGNSSTWGGSAELITSANIGSQSVNYATSAGSSASATSADSAEKANKLWGRDTRDTNPSPGDYFWGSHAGYLEHDFKIISTIGAPLVGYYCTLLACPSWNHKSGGYPTQIALNQSGMAIRGGVSDTEWGPWGRVLDSCRYAVGCFTVPTYTCNTAATYGYYGDVTVNIGFGKTLQNCNEIAWSLQAAKGTTGVVDVEPLSWDTNYLYSIRIHRSSSVTNITGFRVDYIAIVV